MLDLVVQLAVEAMSTNLNNKKTRQIIEEIDKFQIEVVDIHNPFVVAEVSFQFSFVSVVLLEVNDHLLVAKVVLYPVEYKLPNGKYKQISISVLIANENCL